MSRVYRHIKDAFTGVFRHFALSLSSMSSVTVTLILMSLFLFLSANLDAITKEIEQGVQIHVQIDREFEEAFQIDAIEKEIKSIPNVKSVSFSDKEQELEYFIKASGSEDAERLYGPYRGENNPFMHAFLVTVIDGNTIKDVNEQISALPGVYYSSYGGEGTAQFMKSLEQTRNIGLIIVVALSVVAVFLIANTIRVSIHSRRKEISIMRTVGASNWYIRWPFIIEGMIIGAIGSIIPILISIFGYQYLYDGNNGIVMSSMFHLVPANPLVYEISLALFALGIGVGALGSLLTVGRYLRWSR